MNEDKLIKIDFEVSSGYPAGKKIYYKCTVCGDVIFSLPEHFAECSCQNITVDRAGGRLSVEKKDCLEVYKKR
ncbi:hypothetical protein VA7868_02049 [Vibrio aerogenes CECT 7868]|uniref:Uncharacterized protein n=1 Tax=Vibrio aerogenes CECT 7868 TaxID=1216006 RepID=A0A1M5YX12_9VIBR|nr:hypothetical protein [Vibrio aerogenes]SHI16420.1 hypothetical protein VA7868_02049 [Vibrio aerogenes CECT 7868]